MHDTKETAPAQAERVFHATVTGCYRREDGPDGEPRYQHTIAQQLGVQSIGFEFRVSLPAPLALDSPVDIILRPVSAS